MGMVKPCCKKYGQHTGYCSGCPGFRRGELSAKHECLGRADWCKKGVELQPGNEPWWQDDVAAATPALGEDFGEHEGFHTVAGLVLHHLSRVPNEGDILQLGRFEVEVIDMDDRRIDKLLFRAIIPGQAETPTDTN